MNTSSPTNIHSPLPLSKLQAVLVWTVRILLIIAFTAAALLKLTAHPSMIDAFEQIGFGQWLRIFSSVFEAVGVIFLLLPRGAFYGALMLGATMVGAVLIHTVLLGDSPLEAVILGLMTAYVAWQKRPLWLRDRMQSRH